MTRTCVNIHLEGGNKEIRITMYFGLERSLAYIFDDIEKNVKGQCTLGVALKSIYFSEEEVK